jgi:glycosyltransferase involved in cell wall biosynthesis
MSENHLSYVLVTAAKNEERFIEATIESVIKQTILPLKWIIVNDGSTDKTEEIIKRYLKGHPWIELAGLPPSPERHFGRKAIAFNYGYERIKHLNFQLIGNLDADISFEPDYFAYLINKFIENPDLGVAGTPFREGNQQYNYKFSRKEHVSGACQLFRRECFEAIGGYIPRPEGGVDLAAVVAARMKGWKTETFTEKYCVHNRPMGKAGPHFIKYTFRSGYGDYQFGVHPLWQFMRSVYQMTRKPFIISGFLLLSGYLWAMLTGAPWAVSKEFVNFRRHEQSIWLKDLIKKFLKINKFGKAV